MSSASNGDSTVQRHIDDHLDRIDAVLQRGGMSRSERQHILDDVRTQIHDMLAERCEDAPTVDDVRAVLAELDPPESYTPDDSLPESPAAPVAAVAPERPSAAKEALGKIALVLVVGGLAFQAILLMIAQLSEIPARSRAVGMPICPVMGFLILGAVLGLLALPNRYGKMAMRISAICMIIEILALLLLFA